jgi:hypothetical protein
MAEPPSRFGPYQIVSPLGTAGMGQAYRARDTRLQRFVAIRILHDLRLIRDYLSEVTSAPATPVGVRSRRRQLAAAALALVAGSLILGLTLAPDNAVASLFLTLTGALKPEGPGLPGGHPR